jgi:hypothetical protein
MFLAETVTLVDGGFAIPSMTANGYPVQRVSSDCLASQEEGFYHDGSSALIKSTAGAGGIVDLSFKSNLLSQEESHVFMLDADPNTNLVSPRTSIPCVSHQLARVMTDGPILRERCLISGIFAVGGSRLHSSDVNDMWETRPVVSRVGYEGNYSLEIR